MRTAIAGRLCGVSAMCGRYFLHSTADKLTQLFGEMPMPLLAARYNIAPTQPVPIVSQDARGRREMVLVRAANEQVSPVHDRLPVVIAAESLDLWLDIRAQKPAPWRR